MKTFDFMKFFDVLAKKHDLTIKIQCSSYVGWSVKVHKKGYDRPFIDVFGVDEKWVFKEVYRLIKNEKLGECV